MLSSWRQSRYATIEPPIASRKFSSFNLPPHEPAPMSRPSQCGRRILVAAMSDDDRNAFSGSLIYRLGLDMDGMDHLQKAQKTKHADIVPFVQAGSIDNTFHLPRHTCWLVDGTEGTDLLALVVNACRSGEDASNIVRRPETRRAAESGTDMVVLIDHMQDTGWNMQKYLELVDAVKTAFQATYGKGLNIPFVPISSASGDNFLEISDKSVWYTRDSAFSGIANRPPTVVEALDG